jgi:UDP-galactopyranose mutase
MIYDYLIVGAGLSGCVLAERLASQIDKKVLLIDQREHIAGNCYDEKLDGITVHKYGPHIFHTNNKKVWDYLSVFTDWHLYFHKVFAIVEGQNVPVPFNFNSIYQLFSPKLAEKLELLLLDKFNYCNKIPILKLLETSDKDLKFLADYIYSNVFLGYNLKQWGVKPEELDSSVSSRVPVYLSRDNRYFQDKYQAIPQNGYTRMFSKLINHKNIELVLGTDFKKAEQNYKFDKVIYTGTIDSYFDYSLGELAYRSLNFEYKKYNMEYYQELAQVNYPNNFDFTRITEFKHFLDEKVANTIIAKEFPTEYKLGINEPYYPIPNEENQLLVDKYKSLARKIRKNVLFCGRLADYKYYNMDQAVAVALQLFAQIANDSI